MTSRADETDGNGANANPRDSSRTSSQNPGVNTRGVHGTGGHGAGPMSTPVYASSTYRFESVADLAAANAGTSRPDSFYSRYGNVNYAAVEDRVAALEGTESALLFSSGMAAISAVLLTFLRPGSRLLALSELYGGTIALLRDVMVPWGVDVTHIDLDDRERWSREIVKPPTLIYVESPTNPLCRVADLDWFAKLARQCGALLACDATFASPVNQGTHGFGVDLVIQSATKYLGGHSDLVAGTVAGRREHVKLLEITRRRIGSVADPGQAWRLERSLKTLALRVEAQNAAALTIARFLEARPETERVHYPGLPSHPDHAVAKRQMRGFGGMLTFDLRGGGPAAVKFAESLRLVSIAPSLGSVETLISPPVHTSHASVAPADRARLGILDGSLRLSIGVEDVDDLIRDLELGFRAIS